MPVTTGGSGNGSDDENKVPKQWNPIHDDDDLVPEPRLGHDRTMKKYGGGTSGGGGGGSQKKGGCINKFILLPAAAGMCALAAVKLRRKT